MKKRRVMDNFQVGHFGHMKEVLGDLEDRVRFPPLHERSKLRPAHESLIGPVTDYGSSMLQWMRVRQPRYKGSHKLEWERPSASYTVDVGWFRTDHIYLSSFDH